MLQAGSRVEVRGLKADTTLNGRHGTVWRDKIQDFRGEIRWPIKLDATASTPAASVACRADNLFALDAVLSTDLAQPASFPENVD